MTAFLLDCNHVDPFFRGEDNTLRTKLAALPPEVSIRVCTITLGEIEFGRRVTTTTTTTDQRRRDRFAAWVHEKLRPHALGISHSTGGYYADIMREIWRTHPPPNRKTGTERHLVDLGVDVNDVWAVAVAWEHGLTFVTTDGMPCIREATDGHVSFDCWL